MRAFEAVEIDIVNLRNTLIFYVSFWCTPEVPTCIIDDQVTIVENHILVYFLYF